MGAAGLALAAVILLCAVAPPEIRGTALTMTAAFIAIALRMADWPTVRGAR